MGVRSDFEVSILFDAGLLPKTDGPLCKKADGTYKHPMTEQLFQGYQLGRKRDEGQLARYDPGRTVLPGHLNQINDELRLHGLPREANVAHVRAVLKVMGGSPV